MPSLDAGTSALTLHKPPGPMSVGLSLGPLIPDYEAKRAFTQFNLHGVDTVKLKALARKQAGELGGQDRITTQFKYLEGALGARLLRAFYQTASRVAIDPAFLMAVAFAEGLNKFIDTKLRFNAAARPDNYADIGLDRFVKEEYRLRASGYLPKTFHYSPKGRVSNEKNETVTRIAFGSIEDAITALGAMIADRRQSVERDLYAIGLDPRTLSNDELLYWTYVYYNAGSGPPSDPNGTGREHLARAAAGPGGPRIPTTVFQKPGEIGHSMGNAQRVIGMTRILREVGVQPN